MKYLKEPYSGRIMELRDDEAAKFRILKELGWVETNAPTPVSSPAEIDGETEEVVLDMGSHDTPEGETDVVKIRVPKRK